MIRSLALSRLRRRSRYCAVASERRTARSARVATFTSSSTVEHFHSRFDLPALLKKFPKMQLASIGPETSKALLALGLKPAVEANPHSIEGLIEALLRADKE